MTKKQLQEEQKRILKNDTQRLRCGCRKRGIKIKVKETLHGQFVEIVREPLMFSSAQNSETCFDNTPREINRAFKRLGF